MKSSLKFSFRARNTKTQGLPRLQRGSTLIEALVSMVILSFGLLGVAGLLLASAGQQNNSQSYMIATMLANDIIERMKANQLDLAIVTPAVAGDNYLTPGGIVTYANSPTSVVPAPACTQGVSCPAGSVARADLALWLARVRAELPGGAAQIILPNDAEPQARQVVIMWVEKDSNQAENAKSSVRADTVNCPAAVRVSAPSNLRCVNITMKP